ncbi:2-C-methyl-D-erythritol 4-phosphate cytidylyltransferase [Litchfieldia salsa]|uniref:2-C-methyl-D-erythritol 4-phosphate cytidylyltransferase n=1 Tax=Litchfieldia salsa TaxID=930152 RepID=A0A1H0WV30_9BACI|nr:2-C-methyl-D-erythritol 4-phosphate cytidylyltransferase [Litchfieldia salsa]SDP94532.1 2-C-methyl-D-erythritol 4-phosphate cytidylyltransferase [Litchfieldia salsa]
MQYEIIVLAAGQGKRMNAGRNKQFLMINSVPLIIHTLKLFEEDECCSGIILVINEKETDEIESLLQEYLFNKEIKIVAGGKERQDSVYNGLKALCGEEIVLVHDGARPFVKIPFIHSLVDMANTHGSAVLGVPVKETIKQVAEDSAIIKTIDRSDVWSIQTPQAFKVEIIKQAHQKAAEEEFLGTDDASLVERLGKNVYIVESDYKNIKLTTPEDLLFAEAILSNWSNR